MLAAPVRRHEPEHRGSSTEGTATTASSPGASSPSYWQRKYFDLLAAQAPASETAVRQPRSPLNSAGNEDTGGVALATSNGQ